MPVANNDKYQRYTKSISMTNLWCIRAEYGRYTKQFVDGGFAAVGWLNDQDLSHIKTREELYPLYTKAYPQDTSSIVIGQQVGQISRFLLEIQPGDYVITPDSDTEYLYYGIVEKDHSYYLSDGKDDCPYRQRRRIAWVKERLRRGQFSVPFQNTIRSSLTVFSISQRDEFLKVIGQHNQIPIPQHQHYDSYRVVLDQVLQLTDKEFEILVSHLLTALGFEGSEVTGKSGDGGVDATGELNVANLAKVKIFVQAKRYEEGQKIKASVVKQLRASIPSGGQGAFITTADFQAAAADVALETGFPRIGLINGRQLVDLLIEHWEDIPQEFRDRLGLKQGLVRV
jgi:predicted Mrr-cat superfamily restriction endonuclease